MYMYTPVRGEGTIIVTTQERRGERRGRGEGRGEGIFITLLHIYSCQGGSNNF